MELLFPKAWVVNMPRMALPFEILRRTEESSLGLYRKK
jgi:hypothetical protein